MTKRKEPHVLLLRGNINRRRNITRVCRVAEYLHHRVIDPRQRTLVGGRKSLDRFLVFPEIVVTRRSFRAEDLGYLGSRDTKAYLRRVNSIPLINSHTIHSRWSHNQVPGYIRM